MFKAKIMDSFSAAHSLRGYQGDCERLHGHNYRVEVMVASSGVDQIGIVMDFRDLKRMVKDVLSEMDHQFLNDLPMFEEKNPSAEYIAYYIYQTIKQQLPENILIQEVVVWENDSCCAIYQE